MLNQIVRKRVNLVNQLERYFNIYTNQQQVVKEVLNGKEHFYDHNIERYDASIQAFLQKRKSKKNEIAARIYATDNIKEVEEVCKFQRLVPLKKLYDQQRIEKMESFRQIDSQYLISKQNEEYFKNLMDEYLKKVVLNGYTVPLSKLQEYEEVKQKIMKQYLIFFYGDPLTELEKQIEFRYLALKQQKFFKFSQTEKQAYKCVWTYSQQRRVEQLVNYRSRDQNLFDDFRPVYEKLQQNSENENILEINKESFLRKFIFKIWEDKFYKPNTKNRNNWIASYLITRTILYTNSLEFNRTLQVPADFHIEHSIINMHIWMIIQRLKDIGTIHSQYLARDIEFQFKKYTLDRVGKIHLKKKNDFIKDVNHFMVNNRAAFTKHFKQTYQNNPYERIDALVWSTIFFEKVHRYSDEVYLMSEYFIQNYQYTQQLPLSAFQECLANFDVYLIDLDYKEKIIQFSPQLNRQEFQQELKSDKPNKKYYYSYISENEEKQIDKNPASLPIQDDKQILNESQTSNKIKYSLFNFIRKYQSLDTYDYYSKRESNSKSQQNQKSKYAWKEDKEEL